MIPGNLGTEKHLGRGGAWLKKGEKKGGWTKIGKKEDTRK
jgi:hypothetical protein